MISFFYSSSTYSARIKSASSRPIPSHSIQSTTRQTTNQPTSHKAGKMQKASSRHKHEFAINNTNNNNTSNEKVLSKKKCWRELLFIITNRMKSTCDNLVKILHFNRPPWLASTKMTTIIQVIFQEINKRMRFVAVYFFSTFVSKLQKRMVSD